MTFEFPISKEPLRADGAEHRQPSLNARRSPHHFRIAEE
jgi:hypothetical protein